VGSYRTRFPGVCASGRNSAPSWLKSGFAILQTIIDQMCIVTARLLPTLLVRPSKFTGRTFSHHSVRSFVASLFRAFASRRLSICASFAPRKHSEKCWKSRNHFPNLLSSQNCIIPNASKTLKSWNRQRQLVPFPRDA
jgi:hypothetical protein